MKKNSLSELNRQKELISQSKDNYEFRILRTLLKKNSIRVEEDIQLELIKLCNEYNAKISSFVRVMSNYTLPNKIISSALNTVEITKFNTNIYYTSVEISTMLELSMKILCLSDELEKSKFVLSSDLYIRLKAQASLEAAVLIDTKLERIRVNILKAEEAIITKKPR